MEMRGTIGVIDQREVRGEAFGYQYLSNDHAQPSSQRLVQRSPKLANKPSP